MSASVKTCTYIYMHIHGMVPPAIQSCYVTVCQVPRLHLIMPDARYKTGPLSNVLTI